LASFPEVGAGCGKTARPDLWRGLWATMIPTPTRIDATHHILHQNDAIVASSCGKGKWSALGPRPAMMENAVRSYDSPNVESGGELAREPGPIYGRRETGFMLGKRFPKLCRKVSCCRHPGWACVRQRICHGNRRVKAPARFSPVLERSREEEELRM